MLKTVTPQSESVSEEILPHQGYSNDKSVGQFRNQRHGQWWARDILLDGGTGYWFKVGWLKGGWGNPECARGGIVQRMGYKCFFCKGIWPLCKGIAGSPKRGLKDYTYHKEKMTMCKQAKHGVPLQAEQADWLADTMKRLMNRNWKHITVSWQRFRRSYLKNPVLLISHWNRKDDSNVTLNSSDMCNNDNQVDQNDDRMFE
ncbi:hypothetical protein Tco_1467081 [Tanacetum coccineum]